MNANRWRVDAEGYGFGDAKVHDRHCDDSGGNAFLLEHRFEGCQDGVLQIAFEWDSSDVEGDTGFERGVELLGGPPDEVGEAGWGKVFGRHGLEGEDQALGVGGKADVGEQAGVAEVPGCGLKLRLGGDGARLKAGDFEKIGLRVGGHSGE